MNSRNVTKHLTGAFGVSLIAITSAYGQLDTVIKATSFIGETHPYDQDIIRKMDTDRKVGYIKNAPSGTPTHMVYGALNMTGATHVIVRASNGFTAPGTISLRIGRPAGTNLAEATIAPTGGWDTFTDVTVPLNAQEVATVGGGVFPWYAVVNPAQTTYNYDLESFTFVKSDVGTTIEAESYASESVPSNPDDIVIINGTKVGYLKADSNTMTYNNVKFHGGAMSVKVKASSANPAGGTLVIYDGPASAGVVLSRVPIGFTGGYDTFQEFVANITPISGGVKNITLGFEGGAGYLFDIDSFSFGLNPANNVGFWINAASFDDESGLLPNGADDENVIRNMGTKVGYIKNRLAGSLYEYFTFNDFDIKGAKTVTIRYSSGGTGGSLNLNFATFYSNTIASLQLPPTGGWDVIQEITVPVNESVINNLNGRNLIFSIQETSNNTNYKYDIHAFKFNP